MKTKRINGLFQIGEMSKLTVVLAAVQHWTFPVIVVVLLVRGVTLAHGVHLRERKSVGLDTEDYLPLTIRIGPCTTHALNTTIRSDSGLI